MMSPENQNAFYFEGQPKLSNRSQIDLIGELGA
jgi:hypothetical protein